MNPHQATKDFERSLCDYTGAPYAVAVNSCTMALLLSVAWHVKVAKTIIRKGFSGDDWRPEVQIPKLTYIGVPMSIAHAGGKPTFRDENWKGWYRLKPLPVIDSARWFSAGMYPFLWEMPGSMVCVSFHAAKTLGDTQGGAILHDSPEADAWLRRARFDGRAEGVAPKDDTFPQLGWHCYLSPDVAARLTWHMSVLPKHNDPLPNDDYPDLSQLEIFK